MSSPGMRGGCTPLTMEMRPAAPAMARSGSESPLVSAMAMGEVTPSPISGRKLKDSRAHGPVVMHGAARVQVAVAVDQVRGARQRLVAHLVGADGNVGDAVAVGVADGRRGHDATGLGAHGIDPQDRRDHAHWESGLGRAVMTEHVEVTIGARDHDLEL